MTNYLGSLSSEWEMYNAFSSCLICLVRLTIFEAEFFLPNTFCRTPILCNSEPLYPTWVGPMPQKHQWVSAGLQHCSGILSLYLTRWQNYKKVFKNFWGSSVFHCSLGSKETCYLWQKWILYALLLQITGDEFYLRFKIIGALLLFHLQKKGIRACFS